MEELLKPLNEIKEYNEIINLVKGNCFPVQVTGLFESQKAHFASGIIKEADSPCVFVTSNELSAKRMYEDLKSFYKDEVLFYPSKEFIFYNIEAQGMEVASNRLSVIEKILLGKKFILVLSVEALQSKLTPKEQFNNNMRRFILGENYNLTELSKFLISIGYQHTYMVEGKGQFSIRGEILDIFPINEGSPYRIDFFDDEVDSIKTFDIVSQRSISMHEQINIFPAKELFFDQKTGALAVKKIKDDLKKIINNSRCSEVIKKIEERVLEDVEKIENGIFFAGIEKYMSYFYEQVSLIDYLPLETLFFIDEYNKIEQAVQLFFTQFSETIKDAVERGNALPSSINSIYDSSQVLNLINSQKAIYLSAFSQTLQDIQIKREINIPSRSIPSFNGKMGLLIEDIKKWRQDNKKIVILSGTMPKAKRLSQILSDNNIFCTIVEDIHPPKDGEVIVTHRGLNTGFEYLTINLIIISDKEILGEEKKRPKHKKQFGEKIRIFSELNTGDYVVHQVHGIGEYMGIEKLKVEGIIKDYFKIRYIQGDLYVPVSQLDLIQKYIGSEGKKPKINKLGGSDWNKIKLKVKESVKDLAKGLIELYAQREMLKGYPFSKDNVWQGQFEDTFLYEETEGQLQSIKEVKEDMEKERPMDRLLCGDVGYGKTEVAIRAAFKTVMDEKQVAYLVPTTILAQQHYNNFVERMRDFPVSIEMLSRFRTQKEQKKIVKEIKDGLVDIVIGTHRMLQKDVYFKDLGLIIVDEEQRFGVTHKEKLKLLKKNVDVLTLTATPIPRTLHMALIGVRDMSVINEPPEERYPVQTYVLEYNSEVVRTAIIREISRGGQVFYLHNRVVSIHKAASFIQNLVPEAKVAYAHGQMSETELEDMIIDFLEKRYNVLVCTTIVETGIDIQNVNTIIIEDADKMGLAQLYQLRGRVGRSNRQAYAYLTFRKDKVLSEEAEKRLKAIKEFTEFGSGFKIAMRDLEIRGAGNLIGPEQHGRMNLVGYDMYCKILEESIKELKGEEVKQTVETLIDINASAYIDDDYINESIQKIDMYKKIASIETKEDIDEIKAELLDRYGNIPIEVENLIEVAFIKALCNTLKISSLVQKHKDIIITFVSADSIDLKVVGEITNIFKRRILFTASNNPYITFKINDIPDDKILVNIKILLQNLKKPQEL